MRVIDPVMHELAARMARRAGKPCIRKNRVVAVHQETLAKNLDNLFEDYLFPVVQEISLETGRIFCRCGTESTCVEGLCQHLAGRNHIACRCKLSMRERAGINQFQYWLREQKQDSSCCSVFPLPTDGDPRSVW
jgi:hypothetical protein